MFLKPATDMYWPPPTKEQLAAQHERLLRMARGEELLPPPRPKMVHVSFELSPEEAERLRQLGGEGWLRKQLAEPAPAATSRSDLWSG